MRVDARLALIDPGERLLLLSHCLRPSQTCPGKMQRAGMACPEDCAEDCVLSRLRRAARAAGYKGVCIAAGGAMALRSVRDNSPRGIVAVACHKELAEGVQAVLGMFNDGHKPPTIVTVPLLRDGCVDTLVDEARALAAINLGCRPATGS